MGPPFLRVSERSVRAGNLHARDGEQGRARPAAARSRDRRNARAHEVTVHDLARSPTLDVQRLRVSHNRDMSAAAPPSAPRAAPLAAFAVLAVLVVTVDTRSYGLIPDGREM